MNRWYSAYSEHVYAVLRIVVGFMFACHGAQKWFGVLGGTVQIHTAKGLVAGTVELAGGVLIALGLLTRVAAFISSGEMAVAYFLVHAKTSFFPIINKGDLPVVYCFLFLYIATRGGGRFSLDALLRRDSGENRDT
jgi:putative oxidoreductase